MLQDSSIKIGKRTFISAVIILGCLMIIAGVLTHLVPAGRFEREFVDGREIVVPGTFKQVAGGGYPVWRWFTAPFEVLWGPDRVMVISVILFILIIGGSFSVLEQSGVLAAAITRIVSAVGHRKYLLLSLITLFFMLFGSLLGILEEIVPLVPLAVALAWSLGWDSLTGLGMSLLATGFGFSAALTNPFTIGVAQRLAELPAFSGIGFRAIVFVLIYIILVVFLVRHAKKVEKNPEASLVLNVDSAKRGSLGWFTFCLLGVIAVIVAAPLIPELSDYTMPLVALLFFVGAIGAGLLSGKGVLRAFGKGVLGILPGMFLIMMAMSVKFIISQGGVMDTLLFYAAGAISRTSPAGAAILTYIVVLVLEFYIGSATAKAFLVMPILAPLADLVGITRQVSVLAFAFGDGFTNVLYPTNPMLLIALGLTVVSYPKWLRWTIGLQLVVTVLSVLLLLAAVAINLGPF
ncbi:MAG: YfcC family protein [Firmicutes bacterium]|nr:YfcC family protein [Bacillota bacterium]